MPVERLATGRRSSASNHTDGVTSPIVNSIGTSRDATVTEQTTAVSGEANMTDAAIDVTDTGTRVMGTGTDVVDVGIGTATEIAVSTGVSTLSGSDRQITGTDIFPERDVETRRSKLG